MLSRVRRWDLPPPEIAGTLDPALLEELWSATPDKIFAADSIVGLQGFGQGWNEAGPVLNKVLGEVVSMETRRAVTIQSIGFTLFKGMLAPGKDGGMPGLTHADTFYGDDHALLVSLGATTEFATGRIVTDKKSSIKYLSDLAFGIEFGPEPRFLECSIAFCQPKVGEVAVLTSENLHRSPTNREKVPIRRMFMKFDVTTPRHGLRQRLSNLSRAA